MSNCSASCAIVRSFFRAARATFALKAGVWFRRARFFIFAPDSQAKHACRQAEFPLNDLFKIPEPPLPRGRPSQPPRPRVMHEVLLARASAALSPLRRQNPREEPDVLAAHAGIRAGGGWHSRSYRDHRPDRNAALRRA